MFCKECHKNLKDFDALIDKMENCPFCGAKLVRPAVKVAQKDVKTLCDALVQKVGESIFANESTLENELRSLNAPEFADAKDRLFLLVLKQIPSSMYEVKTFSDGEQQEVLEACQRMRSEVFRMANSKKFWKLAKDDFVWIWDSLLNRAHKCSISCRNTFGKKGFRFPRIFLNHSLSTLAMVRSTRP